jgi:hypothetical protein
VRQELRKEQTARKEGYPVPPCPHTRIPPCRHSKGSSWV